MSPEYGSTCAIFPIDEETLRYLRFTGRHQDQINLVEAYAKTNGLWHDPSIEPTFSETLELDLSTVEPSIAGPKRPQDRVRLADAKAASAPRWSTTSMATPTARPSRTRWTKRSTSRSRPPTRLRRRASRTGRDVLGGERRDRPLVEPG